MLDLDTERTEHLKTIHALAAERANVVAAEDELKIERAARGKLDRAAQRHLAAHLPEEPPAAGFSHAGSIPPAGAPAACFCRRAVLGSVILTTRGAFPELPLPRPAT